MRFFVYLIYHLRCLSLLLCMLFITSLIYFLCQFPSLLRLSMPLSTLFTNFLTSLYISLLIYSIYQFPPLLPLLMALFPLFTNSLIYFIHQSPHLLPLTRYHVPHGSPFISLFVYLIVTRVPLPSTTLWLPNSRSMSRADRASEARAVVAAVWWRRYGGAVSYGAFVWWWWGLVFFMFFFFSFLERGRGYRVVVMALVYVCFYFD